MDKFCYNEAIKIVKFDVFNVYRDYFRQILANDFFLDKKIYKCIHSN